MLEVIDVTVVIPCLNEEENVRAIVAAVKAELAKADVTHEIIVIDNASSDRTVEIVKELCRKDPFVKLIVNNQNYGQMRSPTHAVYQGRGRAVIGIGADFQDPPLLIGEFIARWRAGAKIVLAIYQSQEKSAFLRLLRAAGYSFFERFADYPVIRGATGFGLYDREVVEVLARWREPEPFFRGMLVESGFPIETVPYVRAPRAAGATKNNLSTLFSFALSGLAGSSKKLLRAPLYVAAVSAVATLGALAAALVASALGRAAWLWLLVALMELNLTVVLFFLGLIGDQLRLVSERSRNVALVVEKERVNFD